jgi:hypothetical protein
MEFVTFGAILEPHPLFNHTRHPPGWLWGIFGLCQNVCQKSQSNPGMRQKVCQFGVFPTCKTIVEMGEKFLYHYTTVCYDYLFRLGTANALFQARK